MKPFIKSVVQHWALNVMKRDLELGNCCPAAFFFCYISVVENESMKMKTRSWFLLVSLISLWNDTKFWVVCEYKCILEWLSPLEKQSLLRAKLTNLCACNYATSYTKCISRVAHLNLCLKSYIEIPFSVPYVEAYASGCSFCPLVLVTKD